MIPFAPGGPGGPTGPGFPGRPVSLKILNIYGYKIIFKKMPACFSLTSKRSFNSRRSRRALRTFNADS